MIHERICKSTTQSLLQTVLTVYPQAQTARRGRVPIRNFTRTEWNVCGLYLREATFIMSFFFFFKFLTHNTWYVCMGARARAHTHTPTHTHPDTHTQTHTHWHTHTHTNIYTHRHNHRHRHTHRHTQTHTETHTQAQTNNHRGNSCDFLPSHLKFIFGNLKHC